MSTIDPRDYPSNSHRSNLPPKRVEQVTSQPATIRKRPLGRRMVDMIAGDDARSVGGYVVFEIVIPAVKDLLFEIITGGSQRALWGSANTRRAQVPQKSSIRTSVPGAPSYMDYSGQSSSARQGQRMSPSAQAQHNFDEIVVASRGEAEMILSRMCELVEVYGVASVADLYSMAGVTNSSYVDNRWGWKDLGSARVLRIPQGGYVFNFPRPVPIEQS